MSFFPFRGPPWTPKPRKTRGFLIAPRWNSGTPRGPKHRKTRCFWTPWAEYAVNYKGSGDPEVSPRWPRAGRRQGRHATITFGYQPKASGKGTGWPSWPALGYKGYRPGRRPLSRASLKKHHFMKCQLPTRTRSTANLQKRQKTAHLFLPEHHLTVSRTCSKNAAFPGWRTVRLEPLKSIANKQNLRHQPTLCLQPALQKHTKAPDTHTQATLSLKEHHFVKCQHPTHTHAPPQASQSAKKHHRHFCQNTT